MTIETGAKVKRIVVDDGKVSAVELETGELIETSIVVSNADAKTTFLDLVGTVELDAQFRNQLILYLHLQLNCPDKSWKLHRL